MTCPRCAQGNVLPVRLKVSGETASICDECDALWPAEVEVRSHGWVDFGTYMQQLNRPALWDELEVRHKK